MNDSSGVWRCGSGLELSVHFGQRLADEYAMSFRPGRNAAFPLNIGVYYCPGCGTKLDGALVCADCGKSFAPFLYELVELHPHPGEYKKR